MKLLLITTLLLLASCAHQPTACEKFNKTLDEKIEQFHESIKNLA